MPSRNELSQASQTEFVEQAQFLEKKSLKLLNLRDLKKNKSLLPFYILIFVLFFAFLLTMLSIFFKKQPQLNKSVEQKEENVKLDPLSQRAYELKQDLKEQDPTKQSLPFPRVDLEFNIN